MNMNLNMKRIVRIGVDLDSKNMFRLLKTYFNGLRFGRVDVKETRNGFHIRIFTRKTFSIKEKLNIRRLLGDDPERLGWDEIKLIMGAERFIDTLFEVKRINGKVVSREEPFNPLSLPWWSKCPARKF